MLKLNDIIKDVNLKSRQTTNLTYCNVILFFIHCLEEGIGDEQYLKYKVARFYKYVQDHQCANNSFKGWSKTIPFLLDNMDQFEEGGKRGGGGGANYLDLQKYVRTK